MGCDIHIVLERKYRNKWVGVNTFKGHHMRPWTLKKDQFDWAGWPCTDRNYHLFAMLARVRDYAGSEVDEKDKHNPRGVPRNASALTKMEIAHWGIDGHSHSYMSLKEALPLFIKAYNGYNKEKFCQEYYWFGVEEEIDGKLEDHRIVFWFDN